MTRLQQLQKSGIRRAGTSTRGFTYANADGTKVSAANLKRIRELAIPPAWRQVWINAAADGDVQAIGQDAAGRLQSLYHTNHVRRQGAKKFRRLIKFAEALPKMRTTVAFHIKQPGLGREPVMAAMLRILSVCFLRPGSQVYASENGSFGLATLRPRHIKVKGDMVEFQFTGKSGVQQQHQLKDRQVAMIVGSLLKRPSREVFKYQDSDDDSVNVTRQHINDYIHEVMGDNFSAKDFRTWAGTLVCACALARLDAEIVGNRASRKRMVVEAIKETSGILGNTPAVCRSAYISPEIINGFESGKVIARYFNTLDELVSYRGRTLHAAEKSLLAFMKRSANGDDPGAGWTRRSAATRGPNLASVR
jgi:DNA topoisomerase-1